MNFLDLSLRVVDNNIYPTFEFVVKWFGSDKEKVRNVMLRYMTEKDIATFNTWYLRKGSETNYSATRRTWEFGCLSGNSVVELCNEIVKYYEEL